MADSLLPPPATHSPHRYCNISLDCWRIVTICIAVLLWLAWFSGFILIHRAVVHPRQGTYDLTDVNLKLFNLTHDNITSSYSLDADVDLKLLFKNPNKKMALIVQDVTVRALIFNGEEQIGEVVVVPSFYEEPKDERTVMARAIAVNRILSKTVGAEMQAQIDRNDITLRVLVTGRKRGDDDFIFDEQRPIRLTCMVNLTAPQAGTASVIGKKCEW